MSQSTSHQHLDHLDLVEMVCFMYYHLLMQQIFMLQKEDVAFTFCKMENCCTGEVVIRPTNSVNLQHNIVVRQVAGKCCPYYCRAFIRH